MTIPRIIEEGSDEHIQWCKDTSALLGQAVHYVNHEMYQQRSERLTVTHCPGFDQEIHVRMSSGGKPKFYLAVDHGGFIWASKGVYKTLSHAKSDAAVMSFVGSLP